MASRDEWFTIHTSDAGEGSLTKSVGPRHLADGFSVDPEYIPAIRAAFEQAVGEMRLARQAMNSMQFMHGGSVNPVVDRYLDAVADVGYGDQGSVTMAADSAIAEYQNVVEQLDLIMAGYQNREGEIADGLGRLPS